MLLSIIIPVYNEPDLPKLLKKLYKVNFPYDIEVIVIDDGSTDGTKEWIEQNKEIYHYKYFLHAKNRGKGAALITGFQKATGDIIVVQDADLEYNPENIKNVIQPIVENKTKVCYGSRILGQERFITQVGWQNKNRKSYLSAYLGGRLVTIFCNLLFFSHLTDEPTCYKAFEKKLLDTITLHSTGFELEPELTAKILKKTKITEVPIEYYPRTFEEGKKINWRDGIKALWTLLKYRFND